MLRFMFYLFHLLFTTKQGSSEFGLCKFEVKFATKKEK